MRALFLTTAVAALTAGTVFAQDTTAPTAPAAPEAGTSAPADGTLVPETEAPETGVDGAAGTDTMPETDMDATQETDAMPETGATDVPATDMAEAGTPFDDMPVRDIVGMNVLSSEDEDVGEVDALIREGDSVNAIVGVGGFLGIGERDMSIPLADFTQSEDGLMLTTMNREQIEGLPAYEGEAEELPMDVTVAGDPVMEDEELADPTMAPAETEAPANN